VHIFLIKIFSDFVIFLSEEGEGEGDEEEEGGG
jgi:hypothetical protein